MKKTRKAKKIDAREVLFGSLKDKSLTSKFPIAVHEFSKAGLLNTFVDVLESVADKRSIEYRLLNTYLDDAKVIGPVSSSGSRAAEDKGYKTVVVSLRDLGTIKKYVRPFKRELSRLILEKFGSYVEFAKDVDLEASNISKFFTHQVDSKPRMKTMDKFSKSLGVDEIEVKLYPGDLEEVK